MNQVSSSQFKACSCSDTHCIAVTHDGRAFTWALTSLGNKFGQLCSPSASSSPIQSPSFDSRHEVNIGQRVIAVGAGGDKSAGHTALVGENGALYMCGCDRWQQLGLATQKEKAAIGGNSAGYTWEGGKVWQSSPQRVAALAGVSISKVITPTRCCVLVTECHRLLSEETTRWPLTPTSALCTHGVRVQKGNSVLQAKPSCGLPPYRLFSARQWAGLLPCRNCTLSAIALPQSTNHRRRRSLLWFLLAKIAGSLKPPFVTRSSLPT